MWWVRWKRLKTCGTRLFLSEPWRAGCAQAVGVCLSHTHTHTHPVSSLSNSWRKFFVFICWEEQTSRKQTSRKSSRNIASLLWFVETSHSSANKALGAGSCNVHAANITHLPPSNIYHLHRQSSGQISFWKKSANKTQIIISTVHSSQEGKHRHITQ